MDNRRKITLIHKEGQKGKLPNKPQIHNMPNYDWKKLTAKIREETDHSLKSRGLLPEKRKDATGNKGNRWSTINWSPLPQGM